MTTTDVTVVRPDRIDLDLRDVLDGQLILLRRALTTLGYLEPLRRATLDSVRETVSPQAAELIAAAGVERLHEFVTLQQAVAVRTDLETRVRPLARRLLLAVVGALSPQQDRIYVGEHLGIRLMPPQRTVQRGELDHDYYAGFMVARDAHVDSWFNTAINSVNLWAGIGPVRAGNGLLFWPHAYRSPLRHDGWTLVPGQQVGEPVDIALDPGDVLVFAGDHLHASRPNDTDETRFALTKRLCLGAPRYNPQATGWVPYLDPRLLGTRLERLAPLRSRLTAGGMREIWRTVRNGAAK